MNLSDGELVEQVGGWLDLPDNPDEAALSAACDINLTTLAASVERYAQFHEGVVPNELSSNADYRFAPLVTSCPRDNDFASSDYATVSGLVLTGLSDEEKSHALLVYEKRPCAGGRHGVVFANGGIKRLDDAELNAAIESTKALTAK
jgi:hypothetical protein